MTMARVEQRKAMRGGVGLRAYDEERACPGFTLFAPMYGDGTISLIDLHGAVVHTWRMPYPPGLYGHLTPAGTLFYCGKTLEQSDRFISTQPWKGGAVLEATWGGDILWEIRHPDHHHDAAKLRNGNILLLCLALLPRELISQIRGGIPGTEHDGQIYADYLVEMTTDGQTVWEWRSWEHLDPATTPITAAQEFRHEWTHGNSVAELPDGNIVVSFRHISTVAIIERGSGEIIWRLGAPPLAQQHAPIPLPNGNLLLFDNGTHRLDAPQPYSRILEIDPAKAIVWSYQARPPIDFFSPLISNAQRLANGNTLICEGSFGRLFEVTREGELVWEYVNPSFGHPANVPGSPETNSVFRAFRYSEEEIARAKRAR
jgi:hypothetical protein